MRTLLRYALWTGTAVLIAVLGCAIYDALGEAYGAGPPYYGRTTNMDKWSSPWPFVTGAIIVGAAAVVITRRLTRRA